MGESKHTPGPWFLSGAMTLYVEAMIGSGGRRLIQEICSVGPTAEDSGYGAQQAANARLIAAAPELLDALIVCCELIEGEGIDPPGNARAAIAKATGGE